MALRLYDNTRLSDFRRCPRYFYFRHRRHWKPKGRSNPLVFGGAWHAAQEVIWDVMDKGERDIETITKLAFAAFMEYWTNEGFPEHLTPEDEKDMLPRTPGVALEMIVDYAARHVKMINLHGFKVLSIEQPFAVPMDPSDESLFYIGKIDKIVTSSKYVLGIEHKTTTAYKKTNTSQKFRSTFLDSFSPNSQVDGYLYALHMMYPGKVGGVWVDAALVHRIEQSFTFIPVERQMQQLDAWMWDTRYWIDQVEMNDEMLEETGSQDPIMRAFPKRTESCFDFNSACQYIDICKAWPNPANHDVPPGYDEEVWDPLEHLDRDRLKLGEEK